MADDWDQGQDQRPATGKTRQTADWFYANRSNWIRGLLMLVFYLVLGLIKLAVGLIALFQFGSLLMTGEPNQRLARFCAGLALYTSDLVAYVTCAADQLPFPFSEWPRVDWQE